MRQKAVILVSGGMDSVTLLHYVRKRVGGKLLDDHAIRLIKCATS